MRNNLNIRPVVSLAQRMAEIEQELKARAYEKYLKRDPESKGELDDWISAERQSAYSLNTTLIEAETRFIVNIQASELEAEDFEVHVTPRDILISTSRSSRFQVIHLSRPIDPMNVLGDYTKEVLQLTAPFCKAAVA